MIRPIAMALVAATAGLAAPSGANDAAGRLPEATGLSTLLQVFLGLAVVLGAIALAAWLMRRYTPGLRGAGGLVKVLGGVMVGPKERVVVVEVGGNWLVLGVTATQVNILQALPRQQDGDAHDAPAAPGPAAEGFQSRLSRLLKARRG